MAKVLIPKFNTPWGVIKNTQKADEYENVLSFENEEVRAQYIGKELFGDVNFDYRTAIEQVEPTTSFMQIDSLKAAVRLDLDDYQQTIDGVDLSVTLDDMLNVDFLIVKENEKIFFYTVGSASRTGSQNAVSVDYDLELDVMFQYLDELELDGQVEIYRAHTDRFDSNGFIRDYNWFRENELEGFVPSIVDERTPLKMNLPEWQGDPDSKFLNIGEITWHIVAVGLNQDEQGVIFNHQKSAGNEWYNDRLPFKLFVYPVNTSLKDGEPIEKIYQRHLVYGAPDPDKFGPFGANTYNKFRDDSNILGIIETQAWPFTRNAFTSISEEMGSDGNLYVKYVFDGYIYQPQEGGWVDTTFGPTVHDLSYYKSKNCFEIKKLRDDVWRNILLNGVQLPVPNQSITIEDPKDINNEVKLHTSALKEFSLEAKNVEPFKIMQEFLGEKGSRNIASEIEMEYKWFYTPENEASFVYAKNSIIDDNEEIRNGLIFGGNAEMPWNKDQYKEYMATTKRSSNAEWASAGVKGVGAGVATAALVSNPWGWAIGGGVALSSLVSKNAKMNDLKNAPDQPIISQYNYDNSIRNPRRPELKVYRLPEDQERRVYDFLYKYGYGLGISDDLNNWLRTRYYFNYIQTNNIFSLIRNRWSAQAKQIINDSFNNGVRIWHVRDINTFKGIANYTYENLEMINI